MVYTEVTWMPLSDYWHRVCAAMPAVEVYASSIRTRQDFKEVLCILLQQAYTLYWIEMVKYELGGQIWCGFFATYAAA